MPAKVGLPFRLIAKLESVRAIGSRRVVADGGDASAVEVFEHHALQQVVDVALGEGEIDAGIAFDFAARDEVADAAS